MHATRPAVLAGVMTMLRSAPDPRSPRPIATDRSTDVITVESLSKAYSGTTVVDDVSFSVRRGEIFGLLGANGAGKTTTVECLQGLRRPDAGAVRVLGLDPIADRGRLRRVIGSQLQDSALPDRLRVGEAVALFDRSRAGSSRRRDDVGDTLARWGIADTTGTCFADLSGGQRQRLFIVLALVNDPSVVFLDELTQGLDPAARRDVWGAIREVRDAGTTIVLVSHFADEIEALCDRVVVMERGRIVDDGTPRELTDRHASGTTVTFTPPPGFEPATLRRLGAVERVDVADGRVRVSGTSAMVAPVCAATLHDRYGPGDLRVDHPTLDDALVHLIGVQR